MIRKTGSPNSGKAPKSRRTESQANPSFPKDWSAKPAVSSDKPCGALSDLLHTWFGLAAYPVIVFENHSSKLLYLNAASESLLALPLANPIGIPLCDLAGFSLKEWKVNLAECEAKKKPFSLQLHSGSENEVNLELQYGGVVPSYPDNGIAILQDVTRSIKVEKSLDYRKRIESLILSLSTHFLNLQGDKVDNGINYALKSLGAFADADRSYIFQLTPDATSMSNTHEWCSEGITSEIQNLQAVPTAKFPWFMEQLHAMKVIHVPKVDQIPLAALAEKQEWLREEIQSLIIVPLEHRGSVRGFLGFDAVRREKNWPEDVIALLRIAGELLINTLERKRTDQAFHAVSERYRSLFENAVEGIFQSTISGNIITVNPALAITFGFDSPKAMMEEGRNAAEFFIDPIRRQDILRLMERDGKVMNFEGQASRRDGSLIWLSLNARSVQDSKGKGLGLEGSIIDISHRKQMEAQLVHDALHDALTGLPNRTLLLERLDRALDRKRRQTSPGSCLLLLDLDRFKTLNDGMGHAQGDKLLLSVTQRIETLLPPGATLARLGGDEFGILLEDIPDVNAAITLAEAIQGQFEVPFKIQTSEVYASVSIGIVQATPDLGTPDEVIRDADTAMHQAKNEGRARHSVFDPSMHTRAVHRLHLENDLRKALERREFFLVYQPIVELINGQLTGFEALVRWRHPERGVVPPMEFIPIAEETGFIIPLGRWVLEEACRQLREWQVLLKDDKQLSMSVNISGRQFEGLVLAVEIERICLDAGIRPENLKLEVTESAIIRNPDVATTMLKDLQAKGFQLSLDDFGTGYSSLSYLHRFPFHNLKIDRSFVMKLEQDVKNDEIVKAINAMAKNLGMDVTAEGVETQEQWDRLRHLETPFGQGYFFSKPLMPEDASRWIREMGSNKPGT